MDKPFSYKLEGAEDTEFVRIHRECFEDETGDSPFEQPVKYFRWLERMYLMMDTLEKTSVMRQAIEGDRESPNYG